MTNLATNKHDTQTVFNKGLTASRDDSGRLLFCGGGNDSAILDSVDSKQIIKNLMASQNIIHLISLFRSLVTISFTLVQNLLNSTLMAMSRKTISKI